MITSEPEMDDPNAVLFTLHACDDGFEGEAFDTRLNEFIFRKEPRSLEELLETARHSDPEQREFAADELCRHNDRRAHETLLQLASDPKRQFKLRKPLPRSFSQLQSIHAGSFP